MIKGYTTGVYDMFHIGHLNLIRNARSKCDYLIVGVSTDELVQKEKGLTPTIPFEERCQIVEALNYVDQVVPQTSYDKMEAWNSNPFNLMFVGSDWQGTPRWNQLESDFAKIDVSIKYLEYTHHISSSRLRTLQKLANER